MPTVETPRPALRQQVNSAAAQATVATLTFLAMLNERATRRPTDRGDVVEKVILIGGLSALAIAAVAYLGPKVMQYLQKVQ